ncbi:MAG: hypothetical protein ACXVBF_10345 [Flavisolibacter sp.]
MKRFSTYIAVTGASFLLIVMSSCVKKLPEATSDYREPSTGASLRGNTSLTTVPLRVKVVDTDGSGNPFYITSDGKGDYLDGVDYVGAILDQYGTFAFNTVNQKLKPGTVAKRWVVYNFNNPVDPNNTYRPNQSTNYTYHFSTGGSLFGTSPFIPIQNLGINGNASTECIYMGNGFTDGINTWRVSFHKGMEDTQGSPTAFAVVTRTSISPAVWTISPIGPCSPNSNVASLRDNATSYLYGYYNLPFYFVLTAQ